MTRKEAIKKVAAAETSVGAPNSPNAVKAAKDFVARAIALGLLVVED